MNGSHSREGLLLKIIERAYAAANDGEMVLSVFMALRELMPFPSGVFMPINPDTLELQPGLCFDCSAADMETYLEHYAPLDPFVRREQVPALLNQPTLLSDVITPAELCRSEFSEFMRRVPYHHAIGMLTGMAERPVAVFSVHRQSHEPDFNQDEQAIVGCIGAHLARAITLRRQLSDPMQRAETGILVFDAADNALYLNAPARRFLGTNPPQVLLAAQKKGVISLSSECFRVSRMPWTAASLLRCFAMEAPAANPIHCVRADTDPVECWSAAMRQQPSTIIIVVQPFRPRIDLIRRLVHYELSPRQTDIAVLALRGAANGAIASAICIGEQTVRDHFQEIYRRVGVRTRAELLTKVLGTGSAMATAAGQEKR